MYGIQSCHRNNLSSICIYCHHRGIESGVKHAYLVEEDSKSPSKNKETRYLMPKCFYIMGEFVANS
jgi:hypothetical protein